MKVFLMYPDQDYDATQDLPPNEADLTQDLELNTLFEAMARGDRYLFYVARQTLLLSIDSPDIIRYRQDVLKDCLKNPEVVRQIYAIPIQAMEKKRKLWLGVHSRYPGGILRNAVNTLDIYIEQLKVLRQIADVHAAQFESQGFQRFFDMIEEELDDDYFAVVDNHLKELKFRRGVLISARLGRGNEGTDYVLRAPNNTNQGWLDRVFSRGSRTYSFTLHPRDDHGARALGELRDRGINLVANAVAQSADHIDSFLTALRLELAFYIGCLNLFEQLAQMDEPITFPEPAPASERRHSFTGLYDVTLALTMDRKVVGNDLDAEGKELIVITGANQGGKSTFLRSIGLAQLMMQCGMFVPAESFSANLCSGVFTHYKREEDASMESGKFDEELGRMSGIVDLIRPNALMLFNESFAATNEREGSEIAQQIVSALLEKRIKIFFVTHLYAFARGLYDKKMPQTMFLRAERRDDGRRTFKLIEGEPLRTSYGVDVYQNVFAATC